MEGAWRVDEESGQGQASLYMASCSKAILAQCRALCHRGQGRGAMGTLTGGKQQSAGVKGP